MAPRIPEERLAELELAASNPKPLRNNDRNETDSVEWWTCPICGTKRKYIIELTVGGPQMCGNCLYALVRDGHFILRKADDIATPCPDPVAPTAVFDEDGSISIDGLTVNW